jgi:NADPH2:quinone reductase
MALCTYCEQTNNPELDMNISIPESMVAVQLDRNSGPLTVRQCPVPRPGPGEVLIRMAAAPINPSDLAFLKGSYGIQKPFPAVPGIEGSGIVVTAGSGVFPLWLIGKRVGCIAPSTANGTWAEYMVTPATRCFPLGKNLTLEQGAMLVVNPMTAIAFFNIVKREKHEAIVNNAAASALGRMILRLGLKHGVPVINIVRRQEQEDLLHSLGAKYVLNSNHPDFSHQLRMLTHQVKATLILDAVAGRQTQQLLEAAPFGSTVLIYAHLSGEPLGINPHTLTHEDKRIAGFYLANWVAKKRFLQVLRDTQKVQRLAHDELRTTVQRRLPLSAAQQALDIYQNNMTSGKVLLVANPQEVPLD